MRKETYTFNTGGNCIIKVVVAVDCEHIEVSDNFTGENPVKTTLNNDEFNYYGVTYNLSEFTKVK